jgi:hypothetical protein
LRPTSFDEIYTLWKNMEIIEAKKIPMLELQQYIQDSPKWNLDHKEAQELNLGNQYASQDLITVGDVTGDEEQIILIVRMINYI